MTVESAGIMKSRGGAFQQKECEHICCHIIKRKGQFRIDDNGRKYVVYTLDMRCLDCGARLVREEKDILYGAAETES